jgi:dTDP-4-amino-4,6-dideoxygalactose transaminase
MIIPAEPHSNPFETSRALQQGSNMPLNQNPTDEVRLYAFARQALAAGLRVMDPGNVLAPAYINDTAVDTLPTMGNPVRFYPVKDDLTPDWEWLDQNRSTEDAALILVHNFGFPNDVSRAVQFCQFASLALIEDCAHSFMTEVHGQALGRTGDLSIFYYRKILPLQTGAGLYSATGLSLPDGSGNPSNTNIWALRQIISWAVYKSRSSFLKRILSRFISRGDVYAEMDSTGIDRYSHALMNRLATSVDFIREKRRRNYRTLLEEFKGLTGIAPMKRILTDGVCPWGFPLRVAKRDELLQRLHENEIEAWVWPGMPRLLDQDAFPSEASMIRETLVLPIHQDIERFHIKHMVKVITAWTLEQPVEQVTWADLEDAT